MQCFFLKTVVGSLSYSIKHPEVTAVILHYINKIKLKYWLYSTMRLCHLKTAQFGDKRFSGTRMMRREKLRILKLHLKNMAETMKWHGNIYGLLLKLGH